MTSRLTRTHSVGRVSELPELELAVRQASAGRPMLVLLGGDSGVGKTRLAGELERRLAAGCDGAPLILRSDGVKQADGELPYTPLLSHPLRRLLSELERLERAKRIKVKPFDRDELGEALADILGDLPDTAMLDRLFTRSECNPLTPRSCWRRDSTAVAPPRSLRDASWSESNGSSPDARRPASCAGRGRWQIAG